MNRKLKESGLCHGSCLCGAVQFRFSLPSNWVAHCHCTLCQRAHGAAFVTWVSIPEAHLSFDSGEEHLQVYASTEQGRRSFCKLCGTTLFFSSPRWEGERHIVYTSIRDPLDREPQAHGFFDTHQPWLALADELPRYDADGKKVDDIS